MSRPVLLLEGATVAYDGRPALVGLDLSVAAGEAVAVVGENGAGKSTLVRAVVGLLPLSAGRLEVFGSAPSRLRDRTRLGYVPQRSGATSGVPATVREVVATGRLALPRHRRTSGADAAAVERSIAAVGLAGRARDDVATLSGGQQQRVLIARALTCSPDLLVLDEPFNGVDLATQDLLADVLSAFLAEGGTLLLVAHGMGPLAPLVSRTVRLDHGRPAHELWPSSYELLASDCPASSLPTLASSWGLR